MRASLADPSWHELNDANNSNKTMKNYTKFMFSKMATKIDEIFTVYLSLCSKCQIDGEDFVNFCGLLRKHKLYLCRYPGKIGTKSTRWILELKEVQCVFTAQ